MCLAHPHCRRLVQWGVVKLGYGIDYHAYMIIYPLAKNIYGYEKKITQLDNTPEVTKTIGTECVNKIRQKKLGMAITAYRNATGRKTDTYKYQNQQARFCILV